jgi:hypothetical protein
VSLEGSPYEKNSPSEMKVGKRQEARGKSKILLSSQKAMNLRLKTYDLRLMTYDLRLMTCLPYSLTSATSLLSLPLR